MSRKTMSPPAKKATPASQSQKSERSAIETFSESARSGVMSFLTHQKDMTADRLSNLSMRVRETADSLEQKLPASAAAYLGRAAERLERVTSHVTDSDMDELMAEAETFVRKRPGLCLAGAITAGFIVGRLLRSPSDGR